jgi:hypothetical protein
MQAGQPAVKSGTADQLDHLTAMVIMEGLGNSGTSFLMDPTDAKSGQLLLHERHDVFGIGRMI